LKSQKAFDLASTGLLRPNDHKTTPLIYSINCVKYYKPFFTIEIHVVNEKNIFLKELIHDIGYRLKTNAICTQIRRIRDGFVDINSCLVHLDLTNFDKIYTNLRVVNGLAHDSIETSNKTILIGKTKEEESRILNKDNFKRF
jgi:tRNA U55 pseudouridine synthase TruB